MYIRSIKFRDWKAYANAEFTFPHPHKGKNIVLIGAKNGYGKTSLLEGIILGLYGRDGMPILARAFDSSTKSYDEFLEKALHALAIEQGRSSIKIEIILEQDMERLRIVRTWHFSGRGEHKKDDEQVFLYQGPVDKEQVVKTSSPSPTKEDQYKFYSDFIGSNFLPMHLAEFFLFDGERVQQLAKQDKASLVKMGIEGILGVVTLRELQDDLVKYSLLCKSKTEKIDDGKMDETQEKMDDLSLECKALTTKKKEKEKEYQHFRALIEDKEKIIHQMTGSGMQNVKELEEQKAMTQRKKDKIETILGGIIKDNIALALTGKKMRSALEIVLKSENKLIDWENSKKHIKDKLDKLIELFDKTDGIEPPLTESQIEYLKNRLISIWDNMWYPPPVDCASKIRHTYLNEKERNHIIDRLQNIEKVGVKEVCDLLQENQSCSNEIDLIESRVNKLTGVDESLQLVAAQLEGLRINERSLFIEIAELNRSIAAQESTLNDYISTLHNMRSRQLSSEPNNRRATLANKVHEIIAEAIEDLYPKYVQKLATEMTIIYKKLAHKTVVKKIEINSDCVVRLLGSKDKDLRTSMDSSAGEDQIFALSLIAAIAKVSEARIPIVMDTPLARLDKEHRMNVLEYLSNCPSEQVILLSQPEEVNQEYKEAIKSHICRTYTVSFEELLNGVGVAKVNDGYFS